YGFGSFGVAAKNQEKSGEGGQLLLNAPRVRNNEPRLMHEMNEIGITERLDEVNAGMTAQDIGRLCDSGVGMHRKDDSHIGMSLHEAPQRRKAGFHGRPEVFPPV